MAEKLRSDSAPDFYKNIWENEIDFSALPTASRVDLLNTPLPERTYKQSRSLVKIVSAGEGDSFLSEWSYEDIKKEPYGLPSVRPMVYLSDMHESVEKSMWCYENGTVPVIGETHNPEVADIMARKYRIDSLIADSASLTKLESYLSSGIEPLSSISVLGSAFDVAELERFALFCKTFRLVLTLPETGAFATALFSKEPEFIPLHTCLIEKNETLILTKITPLVTPIIRYDTGIPVDAVHMRTD
jgi:hypothetical protein